jgi:hypothetical protein
MNRNTATEGIETPLCDACRRIPLSYLGLDVDEPLSGWVEFFRKRGVEVTDDHLGRPSVPRYVLGDLLDERKEREARLAAESAEKAAAGAARPVPAGAPALEGNSPYESMMAAGGVSPAEEFGRPRPNFLEEELAAGKRHAAEQAEAVRRAKEKLGGTDG